MKIEAVFGGFLVLIVLAIALYALFSVRVGGDTIEVRAPSGVGRQTSLSRDPDICQCFRSGFRLAGSDVDVMSSQYRTGFEGCQKQFGAQGGEAWTAGWNARLSAKPYEASCRSWLSHY